MIKDLFKIVEHELGPIRTDVSGEDVEPEPGDRYQAWSGKVETFGVNLMARLARESFGILEETLFQHSTLETITGPMGTRAMFNVRYRPDRDYFRTLRKPLPKPMNPNGCDAVGIELGLAMLRGIESPAFVHRPALTLTLEIWGKEERDAFRTLYAGFRPEFHACLEKCPLKLWTARVFQRVDALQNYRYTRQLDRYLQEEDGEHCFRLEFHIRPNTAFRRVANVFHVLAGLYAGTLGKALTGGDEVFEAVQAKLTGIGQSTPVQGHYH